MPVCSCYRSHVNRLFTHLHARTRPIDVMRIWIVWLRGCLIRIGPQLRFVCIIVLSIVFIHIDFQRVWTFDV